MVKQGVYNTQSTPTHLRVGNHHDQCPTAEQWSWNHGQGVSKCREMVFQQVTVRNTVVGIDVRKRIDFRAERRGNQTIATAVAATVVGTATSLGARFPICTLGTSAPAAQLSHVGQKNNQDFL